MTPSTLVLPPQCAVDENRTQRLRKVSGLDLLLNLGKSNLWNLGGQSPWWSPWPEPLELEKDVAAGCSCGRAATCPCRSLMEAVRVWMSLAKSAVVGYAMGNDM